MKHKIPLDDVICGDCLEVMKSIPPASIDMILCDLPYGTTRNKWDSIIPLDKLWRQYLRIIKPKGVIVLTAVQLFASQLVISQPKLFKYDWITFMKKMRLLTPQSSGSRIQNYIFRALGWQAIPASLNKGDVRNSLGQYFEVKITQITASNTNANIVQIRLWQNISGHHIFVIDSTKNYIVTHFALSKYEMEQEVNLCGNNAHGTEMANISNQNVEWAIRINWKESDSIFQRWVAKYKQDTDITKRASR